MRRLTLIRGVIGATVVAALVAACDGSSLTSAGAVQRDPVPPVVSVTPVVPEPDSDFVAFNVNATDNLGLLTVITTASGPGITQTFDTLFKSTETSTTIPYRVQIPSGVPAGDTVSVVAMATDGAGNTAISDTLRILTQISIP
ncbi:MAG TPA: hypothetical protein VF722_09760 [Gemmatimonadaceae bacterium]|jgi:hypothetical protein